MCRMRRRVRRWGRVLEFWQGGFAFGLGLGSEQNYLWMNRRKEAEETA
jgi:hypothetical protein